MQVAGREVVRNGDEVMVSLPDFAPSQAAQAFVELKVPFGARTLRIDAQLQYFDANSGQRVTSRNTHLEAESTDDHAIAEASKDARVASDCIRAVGTTQVVAAAAAFGRGDRESAFGFLGNARSIFGMSADSLAGQMDDVSQTQARWQGIHDPQAVKHEALHTNEKSMANFGQTNSY